MLVRRSDSGAEARDSCCDNRHILDYVLLITTTNQPANSAARAALPIFKPGYTCPTDKREAKCFMSSMCPMTTDTR